MKWWGAPDGAPHLPTTRNASEVLARLELGGEVRADGGEGVEGLGEHQQGRSPVVGDEGERTDERQEGLDLAVDLQHALQAADRRLGEERVLVLHRLHQRADAVVDAPLVLRDQLYG